jgi:hypothetical protein
MLLGSMRILLPWIFDLISGLHGRCAPATPVSSFLIGPGSKEAYNHLVQATPANEMVRAGRRVMKGPGHF